MTRTLIPWSDLLMFLFLIAWFAVGLVYSWRRRSSPGWWAGGALCMVGIALMSSELAFNYVLEWNPTISNDAVVMGLWKDRSQSLQLDSDHTFTCQTSSQTTRGTWQRDDCTLYLRGDSYGNAMRFVRYRSQDRLMILPPANPDAWDGNAGLRHERSR